MGDLSLTLLGAPEVRHVDQLLLFSTRKTLSEQFWPEGDARHGRAALRIALLHLRHLLFESADVSPVPHLRSRPRPLYPPRSLHVGACVDPHLSDHAIAALARRTWATSQQASQLLAHLEWWRAYYHFVRPHQSLQVVLVQPPERGGKLAAQRYRQRTEALAAGRTTRRWAARDVLSYPLPPVSA